MSTLSRPIIMGLTERFWSKVAAPSTPGGCWEWIGAINSRGYATIRQETRANLAHRVSYTALVGEIPEGLVIDHLCRVRHCVNPAHLEAVTSRENSLRGTLPRGAAANAAKTHCIRGHAFDTGNTYITPRGGRHCRACKRVQERARYSAKRKVAAS